MTEWIQQGITFSEDLGVSGLFVAIILLSYLLEDLAIITAALLASDQAITPALSLLAIFIGIATGDVGLYLMGVLAARWRGLRYRLLTNRSMRNVRARLRHNTLWNIALIRFIPGLRTLGFTLSGLFGVSFTKFMMAVLAATALWTAIVFFCVYQLGSVSWLTDSQWKWVIAPLAFAGLWLVNRRSAATIRGERTKPRVKVTIKNSHSADTTARNNRGAGI